MGNYALTATGRRQIKEGDSWVEYDVVGTTYDTDGSEADVSADLPAEARDMVVVKAPSNGTIPIFVAGASDDPATAKIKLMEVSGDPGVLAEVADTTDISGAGYNMRVRVNGC